MKTILERKAKDGQIGPASDATAAAVAEIDARIQAEGVEWDGTTRHIGDAYKQVARMTGTYATHIAPLVTPLMIEQRLEADVGGGWFISGQADTLSEDPTRRVRDLKTGTTQRANNSQYGAYALLIRAHVGEVRALVEDFVPRAPVREPQPEPRSTEIDLQAAVEDAWMTIKDIQRVTAEFDRAVVGEVSAPPHAVVPANPGSNLCSARWCTAWGTSWCKSHLGANTNGR